MSLLSPASNSIRHCRMFGLLHESGPISHCDFADRYTERRFESIRDRRLASFKHPTSPRSMSLSLFLAVSSQSTVLLGFYCIVTELISVLFSLYTFSFAIHTFVLHLPSTGYYTNSTNSTTMHASTLLIALLTATATALPALDARANTSINPDSVIGTTCTDPGV